MPPQRADLKLQYITLLFLRGTLRGQLKTLSKSCSPLGARAVCSNPERRTAGWLCQVISCRKDNKGFVYHRQMEGWITEAHREAGTFLITQQILLTFTGQQSCLNVATTAIEPAQGTAKLPWQHFLLRGSQAGVWPSQPKFLLCFPLLCCPSSWL